MTSGRRGRGRRGIYLISTLLLLIFLVMIAGAVLVTYSQGLSSSSNFHNRQLALQAALSGLAYIQARIETGLTTYSPTMNGGSGSNLLSLSSDNAFNVSEQGWKIAGYVTNQNVAGPREQVIRLLFRATFNRSYTGFDADNDWRYIASWAPGLEPMYVSVNNLTQPQAAIAASYDSRGGRLQAVPGGLVDIIVEGMVVSDSGRVLARRNVESILNIASLGGVSGAASAAGQMNLELTRAGGVLAVFNADTQSPNASISGLNTLSDIYLYGMDPAPAAGSDPPGYLYTARACLQSLSTNRFMYVDKKTNASTNCTQQVAQENKVSPPPVTVENLPPLRSDTVNVNAGLWVVWNGALYHYPTEYAAADASGTAVPVNSQPWSQPDTAKPPLYNGVSTDTPNGSAAIDQQGRLQLDPTTNTISVTNRDVSVVGNSGINSFSLVVAPSTHDNGTIVSPARDSSAAGSAQMIFSPAASDPAPQFRSNGCITVLGNVLGRGSLVTTGQVGTTRVPGDITVIGKSSIDTRPDTGVALYAAGDLNFWQLSQAQPPAAVPQVASAMVAAGIVPGSGATGSPTEASVSGQVSGSDSVELWLNGSLVQTWTNQVGPFNWTAQPGTSPQVKVVVNTSGSNSASVTLSGALGAGSNVTSNNSGSSTASVTCQGTGSTVTVDTNVSGSARLSVNGNADVTGQTSGSAELNCFVTGTVNVTGNGPATIGTPGGTPTTPASPTPSPGATASPGGTTPTGAPLDQAFSGLVYAQRNVHVRNDLGSVYFNGALAAYGGDPSRDAPGATGGGSVRIVGNSITMQYNPSLLGPFAAFMGGQVTLGRTCLTVF